MAYPAAADLLKTLGGGIDPGVYAVFKAIINDALAAGGSHTTALRMGANYLWVDATGDLRIKATAPTSDTDGTVVGTQT